MLSKQVQILPTLHAKVKQMKGDHARFGHVVDLLSQHEGDSRVKVRWLKDGEVTVENFNGLSCGLIPGTEVQDVPKSRTRVPLGEGTVCKTRYIGGREQALVDFPCSGRLVWLPYENLRQIKGAKHRFVLGDAGSKDSAERFRLKALAHAIEMWNENTGALSHLEIDPLPHQIHLVHHILASGDLNWLIADDVGLGKTIETGMLLAALKQRGNLNRVLLVTPAGLTKQWQEELNNKFKMGEFQIYGEDFNINESRHWGMYDYVIASMDKLKDKSHLESIAQAKPWDIVVFDEAHRLSRRQYGMKLEASQRFQLAASLRNNTDSMLMLSATPHQGMQDKFQALLELLHPERKEEIDSLAINPEIIGDMIFRNSKADVTDAFGNFIFKGKTTKALRVKVSDASHAFDKSLQVYLRQGYTASKQLGTKGNAIGFVMTVYRKLAASSVAAIHNALLNRRKRLRNEQGTSIALKREEAPDQRFVGEWEESVNTGSREFFNGELELLDSLILVSELLQLDDRKLSHFLEDVIGGIISNDNDEKVLIFTEYRSTQNYLKKAIENLYGEGSVALINGSLPHQHRRKEIERFESSAQFLISTEAGGEGINLQRKCRTMINYDLPWNPMRLVQRIGRLYRYGQKERVVVFNIHSPGTVDEKIMEMMYTRIDQVVDDMAGVSNEYNNRLRDDILGEIAELVDVESILKDATNAGIERTSDRINEALAKAQDSSFKQRELFEHAASFDPDQVRDNLTITKQHTEAFMAGMFTQLGIEVLKQSHGRLLWHIRLPEELQAELNVKRSRYDVTVDRVLASVRADTHVMDLDSFLMQFLLEKAKSYEFGGLSAVIKMGDKDNSAVLTGLLRWQNDQGQRMRQEYTVYGVSENGSVKLNPPEFSEWLLMPADTGDVVVNKEQNKRIFSVVERAASSRLGAVSNVKLHPENNQWVSGVWVE